MLLNSFTSKSIMRELMQKCGRPDILAGSGELAPLGLTVVISVM